MNASSLGKIGNLRTILVIVGALGAGAFAAKSIWLDSPVINVPVASAKPSNKAATPRTKANGVAATKANKGAKSSKPAGVPAAAPVISETRQEAPAVRERPAAPPAPKRVQPEDVDSSSDTEGLFVISALKESAGSEAPAPQAPPPAAQTLAPAETNDALGERVVSPAPKVGSVVDGLGPMFVDDTHGYQMRFPAGWSIRRFDGQPWVIECSDGRTALLSVGFSTFPAEYTAENISLDWVARRIKKRSNTVLNAQGYATIMGRKALWSKSTGPIQMGPNEVKVVRTTYILPLGDGRIAEIRIAATPEQFEKIAGLMKNSVSTFRLVGAKSQQRTVARTE